jgi:hypothetical protein
MKIEFLPAARDEFLSAVSYYDSSEKGSGINFSTKFGALYQGLLNILAPGNRFLWEPGAVSPKGSPKELFIRRDQIRS